MNIRKSYWIISLSVLLSLSLALPYCCHADVSELFSHQTEMSSHAEHGQHSDSDTEQCDCGHELVKDYQKTKKVYSSQTFTLSSVIATSDRLLFPVNVDFFAFPLIQPGILSNSGPPIYLLHSVFLN